MSTSIPGLARPAPKSPLSAVGLLRQQLAPYRLLIVIITLLELAGSAAALYLPAADAAIIDDGVARGDTGTIVKLGG